MDSSKFAMWRASVAVILIDGKVDPKEKQWFEDKLESLKLTLEQKQILINDLNSGVDFDSIIKYITKPTDRAFLIHIIRTLAHIDNDYSEDEKKIFDEYKAKVMEGINLEEVESSLQGFRIISNSDRKQDSKSLFQKIVEFLF